MKKSTGWHIPVSLLASGCRRDFEQVQSFGVQRAAGDGEPGELGFQVEDTLTWGNADEWILIKWLVQRFFAQEHLDISIFAQQEVNLWAVVSEMRIAKLETIFNFRNPDKVKRFLGEHNLIIPVLLNARAIIEEFFGNDVPVALEVVIDPEALSNKQLFGYISTGSMPQDEAFERFNAFDESWFLKQYDLTDGLLNFNLE